MKGANKGKGKGTQDKPVKDLNCAEQPDDAMWGEEGQLLEAISKQISKFKSELNQDLTMFKEEIKSAMREEFLEFKQDVNQQLATNMQAMQEQNEKIDEMATWINGS